MSIYFFLSYYMKIFEHIKSSPKTPACALRLPECNVEATVAGF